MRTAIFFSAMALVVFLAVLGRQTDTSRAPAFSGGGSAISDSTAAAWFEFRVIKPRSGQPFFGLLPDGAFGLPPKEVRFDSQSPAAEIDLVSSRNLELRGEGWKLRIAFDGDGRITPGTELVFPLALANRQQVLRCRPEAAPKGSIEFAASEGETAERLEGHFRIEFATCENATTGRVIGWPPAPLTVRGSFGGVPGVPGVPGVGRWSGPVHPRDPGESAVPLGIEAAFVFVRRAPARLFRQSEAARLDGIAYTRSTPWSSPAVRFPSICPRRPSCSAALSPTTKSRSNSAAGEWARSTARATRNSRAMLH